MYTQNTVSGFTCEYCGQKFNVSDYQNDVQKARCAAHKHQKECRAKIKICLGDVFMFNVPVTDQNDWIVGYNLTPPMQVTWVDIKDPLNKELHVVLAKYNPYLNIWEQDADAMKKYKEQMNIPYFTMYQNQINRQISLKDFKQSFKIVKVLSDWINETSQHYKKQCETNIDYDFKNNHILLTIKIPYKTKGR